MVCSELENVTPEEAQSYFKRQHDTLRQLSKLAFLDDEFTGLPADLQEDVLKLHPKFRGECFERGLSDSSYFSP